MCLGLLGRVNLCLLWLLLLLNDWDNMVPLG